MRKAATAMLNPQNVENNKPIVRAEAAQLMWDMLEHSEVRVYTQYEPVMRRESIYRTSMTTSADIRHLSF
jgi:hypothetical protein